LSRTLNGWQRLWVIVAGMLLAAVTLSAQTFDNALAAYQRAEFFVAADAFIKLAEQGDARAQYMLGLMNYKGEGVRQDKIEAARLFRKAADQGLAEAQATLRRLARGQTPGGPEPRRAQSGVPDQPLGDNRPTQGVRGPSALTVFGGLLLFTLIGYLVKFYREHPRMK
jgi:hypothetical protein